MNALILATVALLAFAGPAMGAQPVRLRADTANADGIVTLGDLFENAGAAARVAVANRTADSVVLNARTVQVIAARVGLDWDNAEGLKTILVRGGPISTRVAGSAAGVASAVRGNVDVLTYARNLSAGETVGPEDLVWGKAAAAPSDSPRDPDAVIGLAARRPLRAGAAVLAHDISAPAVIKTGEVITVLFEAEGVSLSLQGKALGAAGVGESLNVENTVSKKIIQAVVTGPGQAVVGPLADELRANRSTRIASR